MLTPIDHLPPKFTDFNAIAPGEAKDFNLDELDNAIDWLSQKS